jgi:hypothetical protein
MLKESTAPYTPCLIQQLILHASYSNQYHPTGAVCRIPSIIEVCYYGFQLINEGMVART